MATILLPSKWATMPSQPVELNGSNPFVQDLVFAVLGSPAMGYQDIVSGKFPTPAGTVTPGVVGNDWAVRLPPGVSSLDYGHTLLDDITTSGTMIIRTRVNANGSNYRAFTSKEDTNTGDGIWLLYDDSAQVLNGFNVGSNNNNYRINSTNNALGTNSEQFLQTFGASWNSTTVNLFANGGLDKTTALALPINSNAGRTTRIGPGGADVAHAIAFKRPLSTDEWRSMYNDPYQLYKPSVGRIYFIGSAAGADGTASGSVSTVTLSAPTGSASSTADASASGSITAVTLSTPTGTSSGAATVSGSVATVQLGNVSGSASAGTGGNASGSISQVNTNAPTGASSGWATVSSSLTTATLSSPSGTATGGTGASASGNIATVVLSSISGSVSGYATTSGSIATCILAAPTGNASSGSSATGSGSIAQVNLTAATGSASAWASASGNIPAISLSAPTGNATVDATASGSISLVSLSTVLGSASGAGAIVATGSIASVQLGIVNASVQSDSIVSSSISSVTLVAPTGTASTALTVVPRIIINLQAQQRYIKTKLDTRTISIKK